MLVLIIVTTHGSDIELRETCWTKLISVCINSKPCEVFSCGVYCH